MRLANHRLLSGEVPAAVQLVLPAALATALLALPFVFTQRIAQQLGFDPGLGPPLVAPLPGWWVAVEIGFLGLFAATLHRRTGRLLPGLLLLVPTGFLALLARAPLYPPLMGFRWAGVLLRDPTGREVVLQAALTTLITVALLVGLGMLLSNLLRRRHHPSRIAHGSARYAEIGDLRRAGLLEGGGIFLGRFRHRGRDLLLSDTSQHHTLFVMPSGAGKSAGHIIPSLLTRTDSAFVLDPKGELYDATAGWRSRQGHRCLRLAPLEDPALADRWNPLLEIERGPGDVGVIGLLAEALISSSGVEDSHWDEAARALFRCFCLHTLYTDNPPTLQRVRALAHTTTGLKEVFERILAARHDPDFTHGWIDPESGWTTPTHPEAALLAAGFLNTPDREMGSIASTLRRALALWGDPRIVASTSASDFDLQIFNGAEPVTLYCVIPYSDLHRLAPWTRLLLASLVRRITHFRNAENAPPLDLYLDEFASLGRVKIIHQILSFLRGYGVRAHLVIQSYDDLERLYGRGENISACQIHVVAATQSRASRRFISDLGGEATVQWERHGRSGGPIQPLASRHNRTPTEARRPLITQGEVGTLGPEEILIAKTGMPLIRARKHFYFRDRVLRERAAVPVPPSPPQSPSPKGRGGGQEAPRPLGEGFGVRVRPECQPAPPPAPIPTAPNEPDHDREREGVDHER
jgi:type IV secretion system protein VirD4